ncbi:hypothetical protein GCM10028798_19600 [Humibacter antri]
MTAQQERPTGSGLRDADFVKRRTIPATDAQRERETLAGARAIAKAEARRQAQAAADRPRMFAKWEHEYRRVSDQVIAAAAESKKLRKFLTHPQHLPVWLTCDGGSPGHWHHTGHGIYLYERDGQLVMEPVHDPDLIEPPADVLVGPGLPTHAAYSPHNRVSVTNPMSAAPHADAWSWWCAGCGRTAEMAQVHLLQQAVATVVKGVYDGKRLVLRVAS